MLNPRFMEVRHLIASGRADAAYELNTQLLEHAPADAMLWIQRSRIEIILDRYRNAEHSTLRATKVFRDNPIASEVPTHLLNRLRLFGALNELHRLVQDKRAVGVFNPDQMALASFILSTSNFGGEGLALARSAFKLSPRSTSVRTSLAQAYLFSGQLDEARQLLLETLNADPIEPLGWLMLAKLSGSAEAPGLIDRIVGAKRHFKPGTRETGYMNYALHFLKDKAGDFAGSWAALEQGMACFAAGNKYRHDLTAELFSALKRLDAMEHSVMPSTEEHPVPVFIVGMHRSGTTLLEQLLSASDQVVSLGELYDFPVALRYAADHFTPNVIDKEIVRDLPTLDFNLVRNRYLESIEPFTMASTRAVTDKLPQNVLNVEAILRAFPGARIVAMRRDPMDVAFSNLREIFSPGTADYTYDLKHLGAYMNLHSDYMNHLERRYAGRILMVEYRDLVADAEEQTKRVAAFCGLDWVPEMTSTKSSKRVVTTASAIQVRSEVTSRAEANKAPKWAPYSKWLDPFARALRGLV